MWRAAADSIRRSTTTPAEYALLKPLRRDYFKRYIRANKNVKKVRQKSPSNGARGWTVLALLKASCKAFS